MSNNFKKDFPIFQNHPELVYLDSASTSQKPQVVVDAVMDFYTKRNANIHRGIYKLAEDATSAYEMTRELVANFINAYSSKEVIFIGNTNQSINLVAEGWGRKFLKRGNVVVLSEMEHHANVVPWLRLKDEIGVELRFIPLTEEGRLAYKSIKESSVKLVALTHVSNVLGTINPIGDIITHFRKQNPKVKVLLDAAQSIAHMPIDVRKSDIDFIAFSSHKMLGPSGAGVLWAKEEILKSMNPFSVGSHMLKKVSKEAVTYAELPDKFETGTGNLEGVVGLGAAISYLQKVGFESIRKHEEALTKYALEQLQLLTYLHLHGPKTVENRIGIFSFEIPSVHPHDIAQVLDSKQIAIRSGHHCCQILMQTLGVPATARASFYIYNTKQDVDQFIKGLHEVNRLFSHS